MSIFDSLRRLRGSTPEVTRPKIVKPVFIVGCGRSGTSMLFDLLAQHPGLERTQGYPDGEDHDGWIQHGKCIMAGFGNVNSKQYASGINGYNYCLHMDEGDASEEVVQSMRTYYWNEVLRRSETMRVLNKQPHLSNKLRYVLKIFPDAKIVHIVRDCAAMVASWLAVMKDHPLLVAYWPEEKLPCLWLMSKPSDPVALEALARHPRFFPGGGEALWIDYWIKTNLGVESQVAGAEDQIRTIRYEDLVRQPGRVLDAITKFCELPAHNYRVEHIQQGTHEKHSKLLSNELKAVIAERASAARTHFGYGVDGPFLRSCATRMLSF